MNPTNAQALWNQIENESLSDNDLMLEVVRPATGVPAWLDLCAWVALQCNTPDAARGAIEKLCGRLRRLVDAGSFGSGDWHETPYELLPRVTALVFSGLGKVHDVPEAPAGCDPTTVALRDEWLRQAAARVDCHAHGMAPPDRWRWPVCTEAHTGLTQCTLHVLLVLGNGSGSGAVARLRLSLVPAHGAALRLVPEPGMALTPLDATFAEALDKVSRFLRASLDPGEKPDVFNHAIAWDLGPLQKDITAVHGPSAAAAFGLGALWLLRAAAPPRLRAQLASITPAALTNTIVSAALEATGRLAEVGGVGAKAQAMTPMLQARRHDRDLALLPLHLWTHQEVDDNDLSGLPKPLRWDTLADLVAHVAKGCEPDPSGQYQVLLDALLGADPRPKVDRQVLTAVAAAMPTTPRQYALRSWAEWEGRFHGSAVTELFVPLEVQPDARGPQRMQIDPTPQPRLDQLLREHDGLGHQAYFLRGAPGAGKSTLLRHYFQATCRAALQALTRGEPVAEWPVYLPLADLLPTDDPRRWFDAQMQRRMPPALRPPNAEQTPIRLLLDGLNELAVPEAAPGQPPHTRRHRAWQVVTALQQAVGNRLPALLSVRQHHFDDLYDDSPGARSNPQRVELLRVDVLPLKEEQVQEYLQRRYAQAEGAADKYWQALLADRTALQLCLNPMHLSGQCELWDEGFAEPVSDRAALHSAWLWLRLRRGLGHSSYQPQAPDPALQADWLLSPEDRELIAHPSAWRTHALRRLPLRSGLLASLAKQADKQWRGDARQGLPPHERGSVQVPWSSVALWLQDRRYAKGDKRRDDKRMAWGQAVAALGLATVDLVADRFAFTHQSFGEFLASLRLLHRPPPGPGPVPVWAQQLLRRISPPPQATAEEELARISQRVQARWGRVPQAVWDELLATRLTAPVAEVRPWLLDALGHRGDPHDQHGRKIWDGALEDFRRQFTLRDNGQNLSLNLGLFGDAWLRGGFVQAHGPAWRRQATAWQRLLTTELMNWPHFSRRAWQHLQARLGERQVGELQAESGRLQLPTQSDVHEVLTLALQGLEQPRPWLSWLLAQGCWQACAPAAPALAHRLEAGLPAPDQQLPATGLPPGAGQGVAELQHLRRVLLLHSVDAGAAVVARLRAGGVLQALDAAPAPQDDAARALQPAWQRLRGQAFADQGVDLRWRLQAAEWLGKAGDGVRYEWVDDGPGRRGWLLREPHWVALGEPMGQAGQRVAFQIASYPVTVMEWAAFVQAGGYQPAAPWWGAEPNSAARQWLCEMLPKRRDGSLDWQAWRPWVLSAPGFNNPLQPAVGVSWYEALAYARFARHLQGLAADGWAIALPTERQWEAGARGGSPAPWVHGPQGQPGRLDFNHDMTAYGRTSPVGVFSGSLNSCGVSDLAGNSWDWCDSLVMASNAGYGSQAARDETDIRAPRQDLEVDRAVNRALRGGSYNSTATGCRVDYCDQQYPGFGSYVIGLRLVRCVLPHPEH